MNSFYLFVCFVIALLIGSYPNTAFPREKEGAIDELTPMVVTSKGGFPEPLQSTAWSITTLESDSIKGNARSLPEALFGIPSIMVQKTAHGQSSPYIRGLTGYHNVLLVDGIRLNHSAMRSGPNQYWSTVELFSSDRIEVLRGTHGALFGADAVGGIVNSLSSKPYYSNQKNHRSFELLGRASSTEHSISAGFSAEVSSPKWFAEISHMERSFDDLDGGRKVGRQKNTGYDVKGSQARLSRKLSDKANLIFGMQKNFMDDVPRTHKTIDGISWEGLSAGKEIWRKLDQERELYYGKLIWEDIGGIADAGQITLSLHSHEQARNRMKGNLGVATGGDFQNFDLDDYGLSARFEADTIWNSRLSYGAKWHREKLISGGYKFNTNSIRTSDLTQGPLTANAEYSRIAFYLQDTYELDTGFMFQPGIRFSSIQANLKEYYGENDDSTTLLNPEKKSYEELIGSLRVSKQISEEVFVFSGLSQGFRPPSLYDLTSTDETSAVERPNTKLEPEKFLQAELGIRGGAGSWEWQTSYYYTWIKDMIVRSPVESGKSDVLKSNGDGFIQGIELELGYQWTPSWKSEFSFSWMDGEVEQMLDNNATGTVAIDGHNYSPVNRATTRLMPVQAKFSTQFVPASSNWSTTLSFLAVSKADDLSLKDETDVTRIPSNGTPSYFLTNIYGKYDISATSSISLALENIGDVDYRVHGSGLNGPGRNFILSCSINF
jgi:hemoglobin/transferrin/lactoferrin receptor protein